MSRKLCFLIIIVLLFGFGSAAQADPCDANLVGWWAFDEGAGTTVDDSSAYDNNGVAVTATPIWSEGSPIDPYNSGMHFDGDPCDYVVCAERDGDNPGSYPVELMPDSFTISCWTKLDSFTYYGGFVSNGYEGGLCGFYLQNGGNGNNFGLSMGTSNWYDVETDPIYDTDRWYHLAATYDGQYATVYVDGEVAAGPDNVGGPIKWIWEGVNDVNYYPSNFVIGSWKDEGYAGAGLPVDGIIDDVRFYNYAMPVDDIKILAGFVPGAASDPHPRYGEREASVYTDLSWTPGDDWAKHDVYFGTSEVAVTDANVDVNFGVYMGRQDANVFSNSNLVPALELTKKYYWRIDEVNETADTLVKGRVWSFTVANYIVVDDFDSYANTAALTGVWEDYWVNGWGAEVFLETTLVNNGKSMQYDYDNTLRVAGKYRSRADADTADLEVGSDWTVGDIRALSLYFYGDPTNSATVNDKMYIALDDGVTVYSSYYPDVNDIKDESWHEWNIDLEDFNSAGVDLANVSRVTIGFGTYLGSGTKGGTGTVYFDDIRVWQQRCVPAIAYPYGDLTGDCTTDGFDVEAMSEEWLISDYNVVATAPNDANLNGWWKFDEGTGDTVVDSSAYSNNGTAVDPPTTWVAGHPNDPCDTAMYFNGITDYVLCAQRVGSGPGTYPAELVPDTFTIACWAKLDSFSYYGAFVTNGTDGEAGFYLGNTEGATTDEGTFGLHMRTEPGWQDVVPGNTYVIDTWYHIAASYDGQYANFYVDGILAEGPQNVGGPMRWIRGDSGDYPDNFIIGSWEDEWWSSGVHGTIDDVRFYDHALQAGEIAVLAGIEGTIYVPLESPANYVVRVPDPAVDPQYYPDNPDIVNFKDFTILADNWLKQVLFP